MGDNATMGDELSNEEIVSFSTNHQKIKKWEVPYLEKSTWRECKTKSLAKDIIEYIDRNNAAIESSELQSYLNQIQEFSAAELLLFMNEFKKNGESIMEMIMDEFSDSESEKKSL